VLLESEVVAQTAGPTAVCVRFGGIYGPGRTRLIDGVRRGDVPIAPYPSYTNRIHRDDCAGVLRHLARLERPERVYVGTDRDPADQRDVVRWLAERVGAPAPRVESAEVGDGKQARGKRCRSDRLVASGYRFIYPTFREGYAALL
jgi:nucleoside-diphosphate-sugar epimerase